MNHKGIQLLSKRRVVPGEAEAVQAPQTILGKIAQKLGLKQF